jgi:RNA polymerase sigma-70 factor (ECF subfamily)
MARQELERLQTALDQLPARAKQVVVLRRIDDCSGREIATRMGISEATVWEYLADGIRALANALYSDDAPKKRGGRP